MKISDGKYFLKILEHIEQTPKFKLREKKCKWQMFFVSFSGNNKFWSPVVSSRIGCFWKKETKSIPSVLEKDRKGQYETSACICNSENIQCKMLVHATTTCSNLLVNNFVIVVDICVKIWYPHWVYVTSNEKERPLHSSYIPIPHKMDLYRPLYRQLELPEFEECNVDRLDWTINPNSFQQFYDLTSLWKRIRKLK